MIIKTNKKENYAKQNERRVKLREIWFPSVS